MPRKKIIGKCSVDGCVNEIDSLTWCRLHYNRNYYHGRLHKVKGLGKASHSLIHIWRQRHGYGSLPPEWMDFWQFVKDVGERPSKDHYMRKIDNAKPYSKDNFEWILHVKGIPGEIEPDIFSRKWKTRLKNNPALNEYGKTFRELGIPLKEYSKLWHQKLKDQNGVCAICGESEKMIIKKTKKQKKLCLDHCHKTNRIRDLLCNRCNVALGSARDSIEILQSMINYLKKHSS